MDVVLNEGELIGAMQEAATHAAGEKELKTTVVEARVRARCFGARGMTCQLPRVEQGLIDCGATVSDGEVDLIYANDSGGYKEAIELKKQQPAAKLILNVLDIPEHNIPKGYNPFDILSDLHQADHITCISEFVSNQIAKWLGKNARVIYNPIKSVDRSIRDRGEKQFPYKAMMVGRLRDEGKRATLGIQALIAAGYEEQDVAVVGSESIGYGTYLGVVSDVALNNLYNSVDYVVMPSLFEGLGLPAIEAIVAGAIPIVCHDLTTFHEFFPTYLGNYPLPICLAMYMRRLNDSPQLKQFVLDDLKRLGARFAADLSGEAVAQRILNVYQS